ncbi:AEC family transporter [Tissierella sp. Yu-01]|uniref:AEC family transporter n=1 Tax=Tissierella sp. Yu-01 TaxID=3035694 RepID=UPI00240D3593|nr:AEC family transporter [Tissierella sp. Yu-01]WFA09150.1 AEC family transporter [Tissierella sp. Yu-01]
MFTTVINSVISLFFILLVGVYGSKKKIITPSINKGLTDILINLTLPLLIISSFMISFNDDMRTNLYKAFILSPITFFVLFILSKVLVIPIKGDKKKVLNFSNIFTNTGFIGFPLLNAIYGAEGVVYGSVFNMFLNLFVWSYGVMLFRGYESRKNLKNEILTVLKHPTIISVIIGLIIMITSIRVPNVIHSSVNLIGDITGPLSMIVVGVNLTNVNFKKHLRDWTIYYGTFVKLIIMPMIIILVFEILGESSIVSDSIIVQVAMPTATLASIFAEKYNKALEYSTIMVVITTLLSVVTIPLIVGMLNYV